MFKSRNFKSFSSVVNMEGLKFSFLASQIMMSLNLNLGAFANLKGKGPQGIFMKSDVLEIALSKNEKKDITKNEQIFPQETQKPKNLSNAELPKEYSLQSCNPKMEIPHYYLGISVNLESSYNYAKKNGIRFDSLVIKCLSKAMKSKKIMNSSWNQNSIRYFERLDFKYTNIQDNFSGVIKGVEKMNLSAIDNSLNNFKTTREENNEFSTFTIMNFGEINVEFVKDIIQDNQSSIMTIGNFQNSYILDEHLKLKVIKTCTFTLSCDHRVIDGAVAAEFLNEFKKNIENPLSLFL